MLDLVNAVSHCIQTTLGNEFLDVKKKKPLLELIPDPIIGKDLCHEVEVAPDPLKNHPRTSSKTLLWCRKLSLIGDSKVIQSSFICSNNWCFNSSE